MLRVQRLILQELVVTLVLTVLVVTAVLFTALCLRTMTQMDGLDLSFLLTLLPPLLPLAVTFSLPFAYLLSVAFVYGRLVADREIVALRIAGVHPRVAAAPALALGAVLSLVSLLMTGWVLSASALETTLREADIADQFLSQLASNRRAITTSACRLSYDRYRPSTRDQPGAFVDYELDYRGTGGNAPVKLLGDELQLVRHPDERIEIVTPYAYVLKVDGDRGLGVRSGPQAVDVGYVERIGASTGLNHLLGAQGVDLKARQLPLPDVLYLMRRGDTDKVPYRRSATEAHGRVATSLLPFLFALVSVGVCLQLSTRVRRLTGFLLGFLPILVLHLPVWVAGRSLADAGRIAAPVGLWAPDVALALAGAFLLSRAYRR